MCAGHSLWFLDTASVWKLDLSADKEQVYGFQKVQISDIFDKPRPFYAYKNYISWLFMFCLKSGQPYFAQVRFFGRLYFRHLLYTLNVRFNNGHFIFVFNEEATTYDLNQSTFFLCSTRDLLRGKSECPKKKMSTNFPWDDFKFSKIRKVTWAQSSKLEEKFVLNIGFEIWIKWETSVDSNPLVIHGF